MAKNVTDKSRIKRDREALGRPGQGKSATSERSVQYLDEPEDNRSWIEKKIDGPLPRRHNTAVVDGVSTPIAPFQYHIIERHDSVGRDKLAKGYRQGSDYYALVNRNARGAAIRAVESAERANRQRNRYLAEQEQKPKPRGFQEAVQDIGHRYGIVWNGDSSYSDYVGKVKKNVLSKLDVKYDEDGNVVATRIPDFWQREKERRFQELYKNMAALGLNSGKNATMDWNSLIDYTYGSGTSGSIQSPGARVYRGPVSVKQYAEDSARDAEQRKRHAEWLHQQNLLKAKETHDKLQWRYNGGQKLINEAIEASNALAEISAAGRRALNPADGILPENDVIEGVQAWNAPKAAPVKSELPPPEDDDGQEAKV